MTYTIDEASQVHAAGQAQAELRQTEDAFNEVRDTLIASLVSSGVENREGRESAYYAIRALDLVKAALMAKASGAAVAEYSATIRAIIDGADVA
jgi:formate dehydrogenase maturation protein FdhE